MLCGFSMNSRALCIPFLCVFLFPGVIYATDFDLLISQRVKQASNTSTPASILRQLAKDDSELVRVAVASNRRAPEEVYLQLSFDNSADVRMALALNIDVPEQAKLNLARDKNHDVRLRAAKCGYMYPSVLKILATDHSVEVRQLVAANYNSTAEILTMLINDPHSIVRNTAKQHPNFPTSNNDE